MSERVARWNGFHFVCRRHPHEPDDGFPPTSRVPVAVMVTSDRRHAIMISIGSDHSRPAAVSAPLQPWTTNTLSSVMMRKIAATTGPYSE